MRTASIPCTLGPRHKWVHIRDKTVKSGRFNCSGASITIERKGVYKCQCGQLKYGEARSGFPVAEEASA